MVRAPCCDKAGLKKGPWTREEDRILINFITENGHDNWRALPKRAGLLRCGKSCRLRWMNYLKPDIKRGNFTREEEDLIINLHAELGNKWSAIVARLPGRTDNEIKNVWHTHLKKRVAGKPTNMIGKVESSSECDRKVESFSDQSSPTYSLSEVSSTTTTTSSDTGYIVSSDSNDDVMTELFDKLPEMGDSFWPDNFPAEWSVDSDFSAADSFWSEVFAVEEWSDGSDFSAGDSDSQLQFETSTAPGKTGEVDGYFWQEVFNRADELIKYI